MPPESTWYQSPMSAIEVDDYGVVGAPVVAVDVETGVVGGIPLV